MAWVRELDTPLCRPAHPARSLPLPLSPRRFQGVCLCGSNGRWQAQASVAHAWAPAQAGRRAPLPLQPAASHKPSLPCNPPPSFSLSPSCLQVTYKRKRHYLGEALWESPYLPAAACSLLQRVDPGSAPAARGAPGAATRAPFHSPLLPTSRLRRHAQQRAVCGGGLRPGRDCAAGEGPRPQRSPACLPAAWWQSACGALPGHTCNLPCPAGTLTLLAGCLHCVLCRAPARRPTSLCPATTWLPWCALAALLSHFLSIVAIYWVSFAGPADAAAA